AEFGHAEGEEVLGEFFGGEVEDVGAGVHARSIASRPRAALCRARNHFRGGRLGNHSSPAFSPMSRSSESPMIPQPTYGNAAANWKACSSSGVCGLVAARSMYFSPVANSRKRP